MQVHRELKRRGVTLLLLWEEYRAEHADGYGYSRFCDLYREWCGTISPTMRQTHGPAEKLFVDFAGDTVPVFDAAAGIERRAHIFVAVLGASNYTFAEARWSEGASRLDRSTRQRVQRHWRRAEGGRLRQSQGRRHRHLSLRAWDQPHLSRAGRTLRDRDPAHASAQTARQSKGGSGG